MVAPTPAIPPATAPESAPVRASEPAAELEIAAVLAHAPADLETALARVGDRLEPGRKELARALGAALRGDGEPARVLAGQAAERGALDGKEAEFLRLVASSDQAFEETRDLARGKPLLEGTRLGLGAADLDARAASLGPRAAVARLGELILAEVDAAWAPDERTLRPWSEALARLQREHRWNPRGEWPALDLRVEKGESLIAIRKRAIAQQPSLRTCTGLIARANRLSGDVIHEGQALRVPTEPVSVLVDLSAYRAFYFHGDELVATWEVGVGRTGQETRPGEYRIGDKRKDPMWFPRGQDPVPFGDPRNPLGTRWIELEDAGGGSTHLGFHGTNEPDSIGREASEGCLRMRQADVEEFFEIVPVGSPVVIRP
jgi:hypothetical protein